MDIVLGGHQPRRAADVGVRANISKAAFCVGVFQIVACSNMAGGDTGQGYENWF
jgi:hypothetical protein